MNSDKKSDSDTVSVLVEISEEQAEMAIREAESGELIDKMLDFVTLDVEVIVDGIPLDEYL